MKGVDLGAAPGGEGRMLPDGVWVVAVDPEGRVFDAIADTVGALPRG